MKNFKLLPPWLIFLSYVILAWCLLWSLSDALGPRAALPKTKSLPGVLTTTVSENQYCAKGNLPRFGEDDGPAQMPKACYYTGLDGTPSPGKRIYLKATDDPNIVYSGARCGDILVFPHGAVYKFIPNFAHKNCDGEHYIRFEPDAITQLPAEGTRINPSFFGVSSLAGRPQFREIPAAGVQNLGVTFVLPAASDDSPVFGDHQRFIGIEFTRAPGGIVENLAPMQNADHIIFDRVWMHGNAVDDLKNGVALGDTSHVAVVNSYFSDFHCASRIGACTDAHAIGGGNDHVPGQAHGVFKVYGNFLEASGENMLLGGGASIDTTCDVEVRANYLFKPLVWNPSDPSYNGGANGYPFIVKNSFELKNACRVLFEGNRMANVWGGFSQVGAAILLTAQTEGPPLSPERRQGQKCLTCEVHDIIIRYSSITHAGQVFQISNPADGEHGVALGGHNYSIHDIVADDMSYEACKGCAGYKNLLSYAFETGASPLHDVLINHVTEVMSATEPRGLLILGGASPAAQTNMQWNNSILVAGSYAVWSRGGSSNCTAFVPDAAGPKAKLDACWAAPYSFRGNVIVGGQGPIHQGNSWPAGNTFPSEQKDIGYVHLNGGVGGDYHLEPSSRFKGRATDGRDPGADLDTVNAAVVGVR